MSGADLIEWGGPYQVRPRVSRFAMVAVIAWLMPAVHAQTPQPAAARQPLGNSLTSDALADLPSGATIFSLLDTAIPEVISDRVDAGRLTPGEPARLCAH